MSSSTNESLRTEPEPSRRLRRNSRSGSGYSVSEQHNTIIDLTAPSDSQTGRPARFFSLDSIQGAILPVTILLAWLLVDWSGSVPKTLLPSLFSVIEVFWRMLISGELLSHLGYSLERVAYGFLTGGLLGLGLGIIAGFIRKIDYLIDPSLQVLRLVPHLAIAPLITLWFGFGEASKIVIIAFGALFPLYINTYIGIRNVDNQLFEVADILQYNKWRRVTHLMLPSALPNIFMGLRTSIAVSWISLVVAEYVGAYNGVGFLINEAKQNLKPEVIFVGIIVFAIVGKVLDTFIKLLEQRLLNWRDSYQG
ncbi:ABC transporter permease [Cohnella terricola]|uniref:ABC transporter permease n=1 Tax=Cohnella terricola TaxID=1289167 RepID=A0A559JWN7_9BACL|nr:ABC transporter permease [Cohnella terricola]TVY04286.1 ABC transporter permease [Cohnella terricola]